MNFFEAKELYEHRFRRGREPHKLSSDEYIFPYSPRHSSFIEVEIPCLSIRSTIKRTELVSEYAKLIDTSVDMDPVWLKYGRKLANGSIHLTWGDEFTLVDGHHRVSAHKLLRIKLITAIIPESCYRKYEEIHGY